MAKKESFLDAYGGKILVNIVFGVFILAGVCFLIKFFNTEPRPDYISTKFLLPLLFTFLGVVIPIYLYFYGEVLGVELSPSELKRLSDKKKLRYYIKKQRSAILGCSVFTLIGLGIAIGTVFLPLIDIMRAQSWQKVECVITSVGSSPKGDQFSIPKIRHQYHYKRKKYTSSRYDFLDDGDTSKKLDEICSKFHKGQKTYCFVNPNNPKESALNRKMRFCVTFLIGCIVSFVVGSIGVFTTIYVAKSYAVPKELKYKKVTEL